MDLLLNPLDTALYAYLWYVSHNGEPTRAERGLGSIGRSLTSNSFYDDARRADELEDYGCTLFVYCIFL